MYKITGTQKYGAVWQDGECLAVFNKGVAQTNDTKKAEKLKKLGFKVSGKSDNQAEKKEKEQQEEKQG